MCQSKTLYALSVAGLLAFGNLASAAAHDFGKLLTAAGGSIDANNFVSQPFAQVVNAGNSNVWKFTRIINSNLFSSFGNGAFMGSMNSDFNHDPATHVSGFVSSNVGLTDMGSRAALGQEANNRLSRNDYVTKSVTGLAGSGYVNSYVRAQGAGGRNSAKYTPNTPEAAISEPETYAMILAGLALLGYSARRRKSDTFD